MLLPESLSGWLPCITSFWVLDGFSAHKYLQVLYGPLCRVFGMIVIVSGIISFYLLEILHRFNNQLRDATIGLGLFNVIYNLRLLCL